ncbi:hypothetical protein HYS72_03255 [Candidatus Pacearchaeota archaeon]|nr:hypothetical protein [Candidatus Pacearchaeota archaeon]MBI2056711.1 hypothetical protein [Candidatus Pacearchaeota archaeon]
MINQNNIQTISLIVNVVVSLILLWTLFEMRNQRKSMYMPELLIKNHAFKIRKKKDLKFSWEFNIPSSSNFLLSITNVGFGIAKNINLGYSYDVDKFVRLIRELDTRNLFNLKKEDAWIKLEGNKLKSLINLKCLAYFDNFLKNNEDMKISLPYSYQQLFSIMVFLSLQSSSENFSKYINMIPKLKLKINYQDIGERKITKKYVLNMKMFMFDKSSNENYIMCEGLLKAK